jgi:3-oxo-5-alpha-steroid 4-dehydrogenase 3
MKIDQLVVLWLVMLIQGSRRLYEAFAYAKPSRSTMWIGHWLMGLGFYLFINIAIWIEGVGSSASYFVLFSVLTWES